MKPAVIGAVAGVAAGGAAALASRGPTLVPWPDRVRSAFPFVVGGIVGAGVGMKVGFSASLLRAATGKGPGPITTIAPVVVAGGIAVGISAAGTAARDKVIAKLINASRELDPGFASAPASAAVSGGPGSLVSVSELDREGARFVGSAASADGIREVSGQEPLAVPIRVFIGYDAAATAEQRVGLAMAELRRTGAFDRAHLLIQGPAGTGYANPTPVDVLEVLSRGDCATVAIGYGLLPSFLSLGRVGVAAHTHKLLLDAIRLELSERASRPRILLYGESLGAKVLEAAVPNGPADLDAYGVWAALWVGTPGGQVADEFHALCADESIVIDRPEQIPAVLPTPRPRTWFLEHDGDPVVRFRPALLGHRPAWLPTDGTRGRNIPESMSWKPGITWAQALVDTLFATNVKPGDFQSLGHDYRADLGGTVPVAFDLPIDGAEAARLESYLRRREVERAERIGEA